MVAIKTKLAPENIVLMGSLKKKDGKAVGVAIIMVRGLQNKQFLIGKKFATKKKGQTFECEFAEVRPQQNF